METVHSPTYDSDFEEMVRSLGEANLDQSDCPPAASSDCQVQRIYSNVFSPPFDLTVFRELQSSTPFPTPPTISDGYVGWKNSIEFEFTVQKDQLAENEEEEEEDDVENVELDLNATFSSKTMKKGSRKLSLLLNALEEELEEDDVKQPKAKSPSLELPIAQAEPPSPQTPVNLLPLLPERGFRLCHITHSLQHVHIKEKAQTPIVEWDCVNLHN